MTISKIYIQMQEIVRQSFFILCLMMAISLPLDAKNLHLEINDAQILQFSEDVSEVFIANPEVADIQLTNAHSAYVFGKTPGVTKIFAVNKQGKEVFNGQIFVNYNLVQMRDLIAPLDPYDLIDIKTVPSSPETIILQGQADSPKAAEEIRLIVEKFISKGEKGKSGQSQGNQGQKEQTVINRLTIKSPVQVSLRVKIAEVARSVLNNLGFNWQAAFANVGKFNFSALIGRNPLTGGQALFSPLAVSNNILSMEPNTNVIRGTNTAPSSLGANFTNSHVNLNDIIDLLSQDGLVTVLAEPNLMCISGETASFLAGGEFPYPVPQQLGNITIDFKQYGVSLSFTPTVLDGRLISMRVRPEVSELDEENGIQLQGIFVPGILTRWAETTVELGSGETFAIAGLLHNTSKSFINALPGLGDLPILGALFRSNQFQRGDSELVILITPYLVEPAAGKEMLLPTDGMNFATFVEQVFERRLVKKGIQKGNAPAFGPGGVRLIGPAGFSIE